MMINRFVRSFSSPAIGSSSSSHNNNNKIDTHIIIATFVIIGAIMQLLIVSCSGQQQEMEIVGKLLQVYDREVLQAKIPCILKTDCVSCVKDRSCAWISGSPVNGIVVLRRDQNNKSDKPVDVRETSFCWNGWFFGGLNKDVEGVVNKGGEETKIVALFGYNDFSYKQCSVRGGIIVAFSFVGPGIALAILLLAVVFIMYYLFRLNKRFRNNKIVTVRPRRDTKLLDRSKLTLGATDYFANAAVSRLSENEGYTRMHQEDDEDPVDKP